MLTRIIYILLLALLPFTTWGKSKRRASAYVPSVVELTQSVHPLAPVFWPQGMPFVCLEGCVSEVMHPEGEGQADSACFASGAHWYYDGMVSEEDWMGRQLLQLRFLSPDGRPFRFDTGKTMEAMADTSYHPVLDGLYPLETLQKVDSIFRARKLYINISDERVTYDSLTVDSAFVPLKYVPVTITGIGQGSVTGPLRVFFAGDSFSGSFLASLPDSRESLTSTPLQRFLSTQDIRLEYPNISDETWRMLQRSEYAIGMTMEELRLSLGRPLRFERVTTRVGLVERWFYPHSRVFEFVDGHLTNVGRSLAE